MHREEQFLDKVSHAKCKKSSHNFKKAVDVIEFRNGKPLWENPNWETIGQLGEKQGLQWGGRWKSFKDWVHFEES